VAEIIHAGGEFSRGGCRSGLVRHKNQLSGPG
jgi:hypothetical protein